jgi:hypothetical protein
MKPSRICGLLIALGTLASAPVFAQSGLPTWSGSFTYQNKPYTFTMIGSSPTTNTSTTIPVYLIPLTITFQESTCASGQTTFDPNTVLSNGRTVVQNVLDSPIFSPTNFTEGNVNLGTTQYIDAFQRGSFWAKIPTPKNYHLLLGNPTKVTYPYAIVVPPPGTSPGGLAEDDPQYGGCIGSMDLNWWWTSTPGSVDYLQNTIVNYFVTNNMIAPNSLAIFLTYNVFAGPDGGLHYSFPVNGQTQTYAWATYNGYTSCPSNGTNTDCYAQDVAILAHEVAEWADDPFIPQNAVVCGALEVGDPFFEPQYYFPYTVNDFTYHLQDLAFLPYFGAPTALSVNNWLDFQNLTTQVCQDGD